MNRIVTAFLITVSLAMPGLAQKALDKADMQFEIRAFTSAIQSYTEALQGEPENHYIYAQIARCHVYMQDNLQAAQWFEKIIDWPDVVPEYYLEYGHLLKSLRLYAKAKFYYQKYGLYDVQVASHFVQSCDIAKAEIQGEEIYDVSPVMSNSISTEYAPSIYDGALVFSSFRRSDNVRTANNGSVTLETESGLFATDLAGSQAATPFAVAGHEGNISNVRFSADGKWVAFHKHAMSAGQRLFDDRPGKVSLYTGQVDTDGSWINIKPFPFNSNDFATGYPGLSDDGNVLYFASTRPGGYGGWDLYVSFRSSDGWSAPQNLGAAVNTMGNEICPAFGNGVLYFSSDWHTSVGGFDVFKASGSDGQWTAVRPMGNPVNSSRDDIDFFWHAPTGTGYFASNRIGGRGQYDVYSSKPLFSELVFVVKDQATHKPLKGAMIRYKSGAGIPIYTGTDGSAVVHQYASGGDELVISLKGFKDLPMRVRSGENAPRKYEVFVDREVVAEPEPAVAARQEVKAEPSSESDVIANSESSNTPVGESTVSSLKVEEKVAQPAPATPKAPVHKESEKPAPVAPKPAVARTPTNESGKYAVQIAALGHSATLSKYADLEMYGNVMQYPEGSYYKIRVGYFDSEEKAAGALQNIKGRGYKDAFIVRATPGTESSSFTGAPDAQPKEEKYMVRLGTYSRPGSFESAKVDHLGRIESYRKNDLTIMLLAGYTDPQQARKACDSARGLGFVDAYVVEQVDGQLMRVH